jgi:hypothetical protein
VPPIARQHNRPGEVACRTGSAGDRHDFRFIVTGTALRISHLKLTGNIQRMMSETSFRCLRLQSQGKSSKGGKNEEILIHGNLRSEA